MVEKIQVDLPTPMQRYRLPLWILLLLLTATILLFPFQMRFEYYPVESAHVFGSMLPLFAAIYYTWLAVLVLLLFFSGEVSQWHRVVLVCLFALVFFGVWIINTPYGETYDVFMHVGHLEYIQDTGRIVNNNPNVGYFESPAFHLLNSSLSQICSLGIFETRIVYLLFGLMLRAALLYLLFVALLGNSYLASLAVLLVTQGSDVVTPVAFWPGNLSYLLLIALLVLLVWRAHRALAAAAPMASVGIILLITFAMSYTPTPLYFIFILAGIYLLQKIARKSVVNTTTVALFVTMFLAWEMYWATPRFGYLALMQIDFWKGLANPAEAFLALFRSGESYLGGATPLWASFTKFFWMALVLGLGGILVIWNLLKTRKLDSIEVLETGGLIGATVFTIICIFTFATIGHWGRIRTFAPLFTVPIILSYLSGVSQGRRFRGPIFILLITLVSILSLPTFLMERPSIYTESMTSADYSAAEFLKSTYRADELDLFSTYTTVIMYSAFLPGAHLHTSPPPQKGTDREAREALWADMNYLMKAFENSKQSISIFVLSDEFTLPPNHPAAIQLNDPRWVEFVNKLEMNNKIYGNNHIEIFQRLAE